MNARRTFLGAFNAARDLVESQQESGEEEIKAWEFYKIHSAYVHGLLKEHEESEYQSLSFFSLVKGLVNPSLFPQVSQLPHLKFPKPGFVQCVKVDKIRKRKRMDENEPLSILLETTDWPTNINYRSPRLRHFHVKGNLAAVIKKLVKPGSLLVISGSTVLSPRGLDNNNDKPKKYIVFPTEGQTPQIFAFSMDEDHNVPTTIMHQSPIPNIKDVFVTYLHDDYNQSYALVRPITALDNEEEVEEGDSLDENEEDSSVSLKENEDQSAMNVLESPRSKSSHSTRPKILESKRTEDNSNHIPIPTDGLESQRLATPAEDNSNRIPIPADVLESQPLATQAEDNSNRIPIPSDVLDSQLLATPAEDNSSCIPIPSDVLDSQRLATQAEDNSSCIPIPTGVLESQRLATQAEENSSRISIPTDVLDSQRLATQGEENSSRISIPTVVLESQRLATPAEDNSSRISIPTGVLESQPLSSQSSTGSLQRELAGPDEEDIDLNDAQCFQIKDEIMSDEEEEVFKETKPGISNTRARALTFNSQSQPQDDRIYDDDDDFSPIRTRRALPGQHTQPMICDLERTLFPNPNHAPRNATFKCLAVAPKSKSDPKPVTAGVRELQLKLTPLKFQQIDSEEDDYYDCSGQVLE